MKRPTLQSIILWSRFLQVPLYLGMAAVLILFWVKFFQEASELFFLIEKSTESDFILGILGLIDLLLVANLMVMVIISGYENFIQPIKVSNDGQKPGWLGDVDPGTIKIKVATSIVGISSIHLLASFLNSDKITNEKLMWQVIIHLAFVFSALFLAYIDRLISTKHSEEVPKEEPAMKMDVPSPMEKQPITMAIPSPVEDKTISIANANLSVEKDDSDAV